jgi:hypothetical protein
MRFLSQISKRRIVLDNSMEANRVQGTPAKPMIYVAFENGAYSTESESIIERLTSHPRYGIDFIAESEAPSTFHQAKKSGATQVHFDLENNVKTQVPNVAMEEAKAKIMSEMREAFKSEMAETIAKAVAEERRRGEEAILRLQEELAKVRPYNGTSPVEVPEQDVHTFEVKDEGRYPSDSNTVKTVSVPKAKNKV